MYWTNWAHQGLLFNLLLLQCLMTNHTTYGFSSLGGGRSTTCMAQGLGTTSHSSSRIDLTLEKVPPRKYSYACHYSTTPYTSSSSSPTRRVLRLSLQRGPGEEQNNDARNDDTTTEKQDKEEEDGIEQSSLSLSPSSSKRISFIEESMIEQPGLVIGDILAIAIASQLIGLLDVLNDPLFWSKGGWFQPLPTVPSTLGSLVVRFSTLTVTWIGVAVLSSSSSSSSSSNTSKEKDTSLSLFSNQAMLLDETSLKPLLRVWINFTLVRISLGVVLHYIATDGSSGGGGGDGFFGIPVDLLGDLARQCYIVGLTIPAARFMYGRLFL